MRGNRWRFPLIQTLQGNETMLRDKLNEALKEAMRARDMEAVGEIGRAHV